MTQSTIKAKKTQCRKVDAVITATRDSAKRDLLEDSCNEAYT